MKKLLTLVLFATLAQSALANIAKDVTALGKLVYGSDVITVKEGSTHTEVLRNFLEEEYGEDILVFKEIEEMDNADETDKGMTSLKSALNMYQFALYQMQESQESINYLNLKKNWETLIQKLRDQNVRFGYTGKGPGYCGVQFIELLVIDANSRKVYKVYLSPSGTC